MTKLRTLATIFLLLFTFTPCASAAPPKAEDLPAELRDWVAWVEAQATSPCPLGVAGEICEWPGELELALSEKGGTFKERVYIEHALSHLLPGDETLWPESVEVDGKKAVVLGVDRPTLELGPGAHEIRGSFHYSELPETLRIGEDLAFFKLSLGGKDIPLVKRAEGKLWLKELKSSSGPASSSDEVTLTVHRRIEDAVPMVVETELVFRVSGHAREQELPSPLVKGTLPLSVSGDLAFAMSRDGVLRVQLVPGEHRLLLRARTLGLPESFRGEVRPSPWPAQEIWVFAPNTRLRVVEWSGLPGIDASRTELPEEWRSLSAYALSPDSELVIATKRRGESQIPPNKLNLTRELWLDETGAAFTVRDRFAGDMHQGYRLNLTEGALGQVKLGEVDQLITKDPSRNNASGVEVRASAVQLEAVSRLERRAAFTAIGWSENVDTLAAELHLPPGWDVLAAVGVDEMNDTWMSRWDLFALFYLLVISLAMGKLLGRWPAVLTLVCLVLCHGHDDAPRFIWLPLVVFLALERLVSNPSWHRTLRVGFRLTALSLLLLLANFSVNEVRHALYPHLATPSIDAYEEKSEIAEAAPTAEAKDGKADNVEGGTGTRAQAPAARSFGMIGVKSSSSAPSLRGYSSDVVVQTGPGIPERSARAWSLRWSGPVEKSHQMKLYLLSKTTMRWLTLLRLGAVFALTWLLYRAARRGGQLEALNVSKAAVIAGIGVLFFLPIPIAQAAPSTELLEELKTRLHPTPACAPDCLSVESLSLQLSGRTLRLEMEVHAGMVSAYRLPGPSELFAQGKLELDGKPASAVRLQADGSLALRVEKGVHRVRLEALLESEQFTLELGQAPHRVSSQVEGWVVSGINDQGRAENNTVTLARVFEENEKDSPAEEVKTRGQLQVPPHYLITRSLELGLRARVITKAIRKSDPSATETLRLPLLPGEKVTTPGIFVEGNFALLSFSREVNELSFESSLPLESAPGSKFALGLKAPPATESFSEVWNVDCSVLWQCRTEGVVPSSHLESGLFRQTFEPWPEEKLALTAVVPFPEKGQSLTIEKAHLVLTPGIRLSRGVLTFSLRTSRSVLHTLTIPEGARLESVLIDRRAEPVKNEGGKVRLSLSPGPHEIELSFQADEGLSTLFRAPNIELGADFVNARITVELPSERWLLFAGGPAEGPAILFWGYLVLLIFGAFVLAKVPRSKLRFHEWLLLELGLTQIPLAVAACIAGWFFLVASRPSWPRNKSTTFNFSQIALVAGTLFFLGSLTTAVYSGLVSSPDMEVQGNGSYNNSLTWYQARSAAQVPSVWVLSTSIWVYRGFMLLWSLWLARALLVWLKWAFEIAIEGGFWAPRRKPVPKGAPEATSEVAPSAAPESATEPGVPGRGPEKDPTTGEGGTDPSQL